MATQNEHYYENYCSYSYLHIFNPPRFKISHLPTSLVSAVLVHLNVQELITLQRVNKSLRAAVSARGLFPRKCAKVASTLVACCCAKRALYDDVESQEIWAHSLSITLHDSQGWAIESGVAPNTICIWNEARQPISVATIPFSRFRKLLTALRPVFTEWIELYINRIGCNSHHHCCDFYELMEISPFYRWLGGSVDTTIRVETIDPKTWNLLRKIRLNFLGDVGDLGIMTERIVDAAVPWEVPGKTIHDFSRGQRIGRETDFHCKYTFEGVALLTDIALFPKRVSRTGRALYIEASDYPRGEPENFVNKFAARLRRQHNGIVERFDEWDETLELFILKPDDAHHFLRFHASGRCYIMAAVWAFGERLELSIFDK
ncbi:unnamed protein product, partial [Mesorhabditis spiculigera]